VNCYSVLICVLLLFLVLNAGCRGEQEAQQVTLEQLFSNPHKYNGEYVITEGFYFGGFEVIVLSENLEYSGYAEGHLIPKGRMLWLEGGIPKEVYDRLYSQQTMGPLERYGKIRVEGKFEYGGKYGHLGGYNYQITPSQVDLLPWSPPEEYQ